HSAQFTHNRTFGKPWDTTWESEARGPGRARGGGRPKSWQRSGVPPPPCSDSINVPGHLGAARGDAVNSAGTIGRVRSGDVGQVEARNRLDLQIDPGGRTGRTPYSL